MNQQRIRDYKYIRNTLPKKTLPDSEVVSNGDFLFYIEKVVYYAEADMTWDEWVNSVYNVDKLTISGEWIEVGNAVLVDSNGAQVKPSYLIKEKEKYQKG